MKPATNGLAGRSYRSSWRSICSHPAVAHHHQPVGHRHRLVLVMRDHDGGDAAIALQHADFARHVLRAARHRGWTAARRAAAAADGSPARGPAPRAAAGRRKARAAAASPALQLHQPQHLGDPRRGGGAGMRRISSPKRDVARHRQMREQRVALEHDAHIAAIRREPRMLSPSSRMSPDVAAEKAGDHAQRGGLAAAGRPEQHDHLARLDMRLDIATATCRVEALARAGRSVSASRAALIARPGPAGRSGRAPRAGRRPATICATATAATSGSMWYSRYCSTATGKVVTPGATRNSAISRLPNEKMKANSPAGDDALAHRRQGHAPDHHQRPRAEAVAASSAARSWLVSAGERQPHDPGRGHQSAPARGRPAIRSAAKPVPISISTRNR